VALTVALPIEIPVTLKLTFAPIFRAVAIFAVAGSLAVSRVPVEILVALAEIAIALEYAVPARVVA
jgi:hypothetical protein